MDSPIAYISHGKNYLNPKIEILVDEAIETFCDAIYLEGEIGEYYGNLGIAL